MTNLENNEAVTMQTMLFRGPNFTIQVPTTWLATSQKDVQVIFIGPKIGPARAALGIELGTVEKFEGIAKFAETYNKNQQGSTADFEILGQKQRSHEGYDALHQMVRMTDGQLDINVEKRQVFYHLDGTVVILGTTQPSTSNVREGIDELFLKIINTFRFGTLDI